MEHETAADRQRRYAAENAETADRLEAEGHYALSLFYADVADKHMDCAHRLEADDFADAFCPPETENAAC